MLRRQEDWVQDATALVLNLTCAGTGTIAVLMFLGQLIAFTALVGLAACVQLLLHVLQTLRCRLPKSPDQ